MKFLWLISLIVAFTAGWFSSSTLNSSSETIAQDPLQKTTAKSGRALASPETSSLPVENLNQIMKSESGFPESTQSSIDDEFTSKFHAYSKVGNFEDKKLMIINGLQTKMISNRVISNLIEQDIQAFMENNGESGPIDYYREIIESIESPEMKQEIYFNLKYYETRNEIDKEKLEYFKEWFQ